jgi:hypothetical protein
MIAMTSFMGVFRYEPASAVSSPTLGTRGLARAALRLRTISASRWKIKRRIAIAAGAADSLGQAGSAVLPHPS